MCVLLAAWIEEADSDAVMNDQTAAHAALEQAREVWPTEPVAHFKLGMLVQQSQQLPLALPPVLVHADFRALHRHREVRPLRYGRVTQHVLQLEHVAPADEADPQPPRIEPASARQRDREAVPPV